jgi:ribonucleoside-diphosphate reductase alpha chain
MTSRRRLPNRRNSTSFGIEVAGLRYIATISYFPGTNELAEIFLTNHRAGSDAGAAACDSAVVCSIALQHGVPLKTIRKALMRDARGKARTPLGAALDLLAEENR